MMMNKYKQTVKNIQLYVISAFCFQQITLWLGVRRKMRCQQSAKLSPRSSLINQGW